MAIVKIEVTTNNRHKFMATGTTADGLNDLNTHHLNVDPGSTCMMKETKDIAFFDGTEWFIW